ncbi:MAG: DUF4097 domain-containing protein [Chloroflexia bacterium]|nr:DUF4097 domain-containing protein [Chloroflexia bacterium]
MHSLTRYVPKKTLKKNFSAKENIRINVVSGDCVVKPATGNEIKVHLSYTYPDDCFEYTFDESGSELEIREKFHGNCNGESNWEIEIPKNAKVYFNSASGNFEIADTEGDVSCNTASGDIKNEQSKRRNRNK